MNMSLDQLISVVVTITLIEMMVLIGLRVAFSELVQTVKNWQLVARAAAANYRSSRGSPSFCWCRSAPAPWWPPVFLFSPSVRGRLTVRPLRQSHEQTCRRPSA